MQKKPRFIPIIVLVVLTFLNFSFGQVIKNEIVLGKRVSIESKVLNEERDLFIFLPEGYGESIEKYPVMYVLDGGANFTIAAAISNFLARNQQIPQIIVVGIPNVARNRDFTPILDEGMRNSGGANNFISFLDKELFNYIDNSYRTQDYKLLFGHSLCGMFSVYTLFTNPDIFNAHIAASPYLMMSNEYVIKKAKEALIAQPNLNNQLYMSIGDEPNYFNSLDKFTSLLKKKNSKINWTLQKYLDENHASIPMRTISDGLGFIFSDWQLTNEIAMHGIDAIKEHLQNRVDKFGFTTELSETLLNIIGYQLLQANESNKAIEVFEHNVELYPSSANVYDSLGDGYDRVGKKKKALKNYIKAVSIGERTNDPNLPAYRNNMERLENK